VKAGKIASLVLVVALALVATVIIMMVGWVQGDWSAETMNHAIMTGIILGVIAAAAIIPFGISFDNAMARLIGQLERTHDRGTTDPFVGPRWITPLVHAITESVEQARQREQSLRDEFRDLEIQHRVSESQRQQIEAVLHSLRDAVIVTNAFNEIVMVNEEAAELLEFEVDAAIHRPIHEVVRDESLYHIITDAREHANFRERRHVEHEMKAEGEDEGGVRTFDITLACVENHKQEVGGVVAVLHDLTRERELSQMKTDFVSKASHELRTPLSSIRAYVEMLVDGEADDAESRQEFYRIIYDETDRLARLIDNMLNISRIEAGIIQIERDNVDMKTLISRAHETIGPQAREKDISIHERISAVDLCVEGDSDMLFQVILNLLSNAVKYTPDGGRVTISADTDNLTRSVLISVSDTGLGIPDDALPKLFDKFFRVENYNRVAKATGLGLSLCQHIVETLHQGQIGVESKVGMGSRFWIAIPMHYAGAQAA